MTVVNLSGNQDIDGLLWGYGWDSLTLTYAFPTSSSDYTNNGYTSVTGFEAFNAAQQSAMLRIIANCDNVCGLALAPAAAGTVANLRFAEAISLNYGGMNFGNHVPGRPPAPGTAESNPPDPDNFNAYQFGDSWFNRVTYNAPDIGGFAYATGLMHELGHALGLKHGHESQFGHGVLFPVLPADHNSYEYSIMTYHQYVGDTGESDNAPDHPTSLMQNDIAALQYMYGADYSYNSGNTVYTWSVTTGEMFINGAGDGTPDDNHILLTVWDGGGDDTYDFSNYPTNLVVDLGPGAWTTASSAQLANLGDGHIARGSIANALLYQSNTASLIERAIGGSGSDTIRGNDADNTLRGNGGDDTIEGGAGFDSAVFSGALSAYLLTPLGGAAVQVAGPDGTDTLSNIEFLVFDDQTIAPPPPPSPPAPLPPGSFDFHHDFDGDARGDFLWQNASGAPAIWLLNGTGVAAFGPLLANPGAAWHAIDAADFSGDGKADILWRNDDGTPAVWLMDGTGVAGFGAALPNPGPAWHAKEAADFNADGKADILWQNDNGAAAVWLMNGTSLAAAGAALPNPGPAWHAVDAADFDGDGNADILWQNDNGAAAVWLMNGTGALSFGTALPNPGPAWHAREAADFNADGRADILWQNDNGATAVWLMNGTIAFAFGGALPNPGPAWHVREAADANGDGSADILWQNDDGTPAVWLMNGTSVAAFGPALPNPGAAWHIV